MQCRTRLFVDDVQQHFADMSVSIESDVLAQMVAIGDTFCSYRFEFDVATIRGLVWAFQSDNCLWTDFCDAVRSHRKWTHWLALMEHVYGISKLTGKLLLLENSIQSHTTNDRLQMADYLNALDGEIAFCQDLADRRDLA